MYTILRKKSYVKCVQKLAQQKHLDIDALDMVIELLKNNTKLPAKHNDHQLKGKLVAYRECHVKHDLLLRYFKDERVLVLVLVELSTHQQMFGE